MGIRKRNLRNRNSSRTLTPSQRRPIRIGDKINYQYCAAAISCCMNGRIVKGRGTVKRIKKDGDHREFHIADEDYERGDDYIVCSGIEVWPVRWTRERYHVERFS